ncbi:MAG TPA: hypothetical protein VJ754_09295, partial [Anaerolineae bacterium]|nr:hypothetical protein [Anaerolineae bacterium]
MKQALPDDLSAPEWNPSAPEDIERQQQVTLFYRITRWLAAFLVLSAALHVPLLMVTADLRLVPIMSICAGFAVSVTVVRVRVRRLEHAVYLVGVFLIVGTSGIAATVAGLTAVLPAATGLIPVLLVGVVLGPRYVKSIIVMAFAGAVITS